MKTNFKNLFTFVQSLVLAATIVTTDISATCENQTTNEKSKNSTPKVSVIVPVYKAEKYVGQCLDSLIDQTIPKEDLEIICVNDGSPDNSLEILNKYAKNDNRIKVIDQENSGVSAARNTGIKNATGKYIAFVDSDDYVDENTYKDAARIAEEKGADILCFGWRNFTDDGEETSRKNCTLKDKTFTDWKKAKSKRASIVVWNKLYKRDLIVNNNIEFATEIKIAEDECFNLCAYSHAKTIVHTHDVFYNYRVNPNSATQKMSFSCMISNYQKMWKYVNNFYKKHKINFTLWNKITYFKIYKDDFSAFVLPTLKLSN